MSQTPLDYQNPNNDARRPMSSEARLAIIIVSISFVALVIWFIFYAEAIEDALHASAKL